MGPTSVKLWKTLCLLINLSFINSACGDRDIFVFADVPSEIKYGKVCVDINNHSFINPACGDRDIFVSRCNEII